MSGQAILSACQEVGMFNVLIIGCTVVYISLSAPWTHLNCQSTSKAYRSFIFPLTRRVFSLSWVPVICYDLRASWQTLLLVLKKGFLFVTLRKHQCPCNGLQLSEEASTWQLCGRTNLQSRWLAFPEFRFGFGVTYKQVNICCLVLAAERQARDDRANWRHIVISY